MKGLRRLHVHHLITKLELGGAQQNTLYCVRNHDRRLFSVSLGAGPGGILDRDARSIRDARIDFFPRLRREIRPLNDLLFVREYEEYLRRTKVDIIHTHSSKAGILGRIAAARAGVPVVIHTVHGWGFHDYQPASIRRLYVALERMAARRTDLLFFVSKENLVRGRKEGIGRPSQYRIVRSGIDLAGFRSPARTRTAVRRELGIPAAAPVGITVGNFKPQKAPFDFIRAVAEVHRSVPEARFIMAGDGELRRQAEKLAGRLSVRNRIVFAGWRKDVPDLLHASDLFLLTSLFEGLPRSVLQAAAAGLPVVATAAGGTPEAVRNGVTGWILRRGDVRGIAARTVMLLRDLPGARAMGRAGRRIIGGEFEIRKMLRDIERNYLEAARRKHIA